MYTFVSKYAFHLKYFDNYFIGTFLFPPMRDNYCSYEVLLIFFILYCMSSFIHIRGLLFVVTVCVCV
jgi:hypothetical protein